VGNFGKFDLVFNAPKFSSPICNEITEVHSADSPKFTTPFASSMMISQKISHAAYNILHYCNSAIIILIKN